MDATIMTAVLTTAVVVTVVVVVWSLRRRASADQRDAATGLVLLHQQLDGLRQQLSQALAGQSDAMGQQLDRLTTQLNQRLHESAVVAQRTEASVGERLDNATRVVGEVQRGLGELKEATAKVYDVGRSVAQLHDILKAPKLRGGLGEFFLADLLAQVLPAEHFGLQHGFRSGERVDAVVRLGDKLVPIDAKFPLEDFLRMLEAADDEARSRARKAFVQRVRKHVDDVAQKYILPDENTYDFALMYIPAENVFYEAVIRDQDRTLVGYALDRKVIPVSPSTLYAYLQAIVLGLRGLRIESRAQEVMDQLGRLAGDLGKLREDVRLVGRHLTNAQQAYGVAERKLERFEQRLDSVAGETPATVETPKVAQLELRVPTAS